MTALLFINISIGCNNQIDSALVRAVNGKETGPAAAVIFIIGEEIHSGNSAGDRSKCAHKKDLLKGI